MDERVRFIGDVKRGDWTFSSLCAHYGVSRKTGYKILRRYEESGVDGLRDRPRTPGVVPHATAPEIVELILAAKREKGWGAKKLRELLIRRHPGVQIPVRSTVHEILNYK